VNEEAREIVNEEHEYLKRHSSTTGGANGDAVGATGHHLGHHGGGNASGHYGDKITHHTHHHAGHHFKVTGKALDSESISFKYQKDHELDGFVHTDAHRAFVLPDEEERERERLSRSPRDGDADYDNHHHERSHHPAFFSHSRRRRSFSHGEDEDPSGDGTEVRDATGGDTARERREARKQWETTRRRLHASLPPTPQPSLRSADASFFGVHPPSPFGGRVPSGERMVVWSLPPPLAIAAARSACHGG
jgi:hypothetical protein